MRVGTTNSDRDSGTVAREQFGELLDICYAPALPPGRDFSGLVYMHGAAERPEERRSGVWRNLTEPPFCSQESLSAR